MRFLLLIIVLISSFYLKGQEIDSIHTDSLEFKLEVIVTDNQTKEPIKAAEVRVVGTDGTSNKNLTDKYGKSPIFNLSYNTSYSIIVNKESYMLSKGKESTFGKNKNILFVHQYEIQKMIICRTVLNVQYFKHNEIKPYKAENLIDTSHQEVPVSFYADIMKENPLIIVQITGYQDESEVEGISKERAEGYVKQLIGLGINKKRLLAVDVVIKSYKNFGYRNKETLSLEEAKQENRTINFKVVSTDFELK